MLESLPRLPRLPHGPHCHPHSMTTYEGLIDAKLPLLAAIGADDCLARPLSGYHES